MHTEIKILAVIIILASLLLNSCIDIVNGENTTSSPAPTSTSSPAPTASTELTPVAPLVTPSLEPSASPTTTPLVTPAPEVSATPVPTEAPTPIPTPVWFPTPEPTVTPAPVATASPAPTATPTPTTTSAPTSSPVPVQTATPAPVTLYFGEIQKFTYQGIGVNVSISGGAVTGYSDNDETNYYDSMSDGRQRYRVYYAGKMATGWLPQDQWKEVPINGDPSAITPDSIVGDLTYWGPKNGSIMIYGGDGVTIYYFAFVKMTYDIPVATATPAPVPTASPAPTATLPPAATPNFAQVQTFSVQGFVPNLNVENCAVTGFSDNDETNYYDVVADGRQKYRIFYAGRMATGMLPQEQWKEVPIYGEPASFVVDPIVAAEGFSFWGPNGGSVRIYGTDGVTIYYFAFVKMAE